MFPRTKTCQLNKEEKGFTLVELIIVIALIGIVASVVASMFFTGIRSYQTAEDQLESYYNARWVFMYIERQIKHSEEVYMKDNIIYLQDIETPGYYNYYYLRGTGIIERHKVSSDTLYGIGRGETSQFASNIRKFQLTKAGDRLLHLHITSKVNGKELDLESDIGIGIDITDK